MGYLCMGFSDCSKVNDVSNLISENGVYTVEDIRNICDVFYYFNDLEDVQLSLLSGNFLVLEVEGVSDSEVSETLVLQSSDINAENNDSISAEVAEESEVDNEVYNNGIDNGIHTGDCTENDNTYNEVEVTEKDDIEEIEKDAIKEEVLEDSSIEEATEYADIGDFVVDNDSSNEEYVNTESEEYEDIEGELIEGYENNYENTEYEEYEDIEGDVIEEYEDTETSDNVNSSVDANSDYSTFNYENSDYTLNLSEQSQGIANSIYDNTNNSSVSYSSTMPLLDFLRKNKDIRDVETVSKYYSKDVIKAAVQLNTIIVKKGKIYI